MDFRRFGGTDGRSSFAPQGNVLDPTLALHRRDRPALPAGELETAAAAATTSMPRLLTAYNGADRWSAMAVGHRQDHQRRSRRSPSSPTAKSEDHFEAHPVPDFFVVPTGQYYAGRFMQGGPRITDRESDPAQQPSSASKARLQAASTGSSPSARARARSPTVTRTTTTPTSGSRRLEAGLIDATVSTNDPAFVESLKVTPQREGKSTVEFVNLQVVGRA